MLAPTTSAFARAPGTPPVGTGLDKPTLESLSNDPPFVYQ